MMYYKTLLEIPDESYIDALDQMQLVRCMIEDIIETGGLPLSVAKYIGIDFYVAEA